MPHTESNNAAAPHLALITVQVLFATWPIVGKIALHSVPSIALVGFRVAGASIMLLTIAGMRGSLQTIRKADWPLLILSSLLGLVLNQLLFTKGLSLTTAINATLLSTTIPVFTLLVGVVLGTDRATLRRLVGIALAGGGVLYLIGPGRANFATVTHVGDWLIVANSLCYGAYIAVSKNLMKRYNALSVIAWIFVVGCVITVPAGAISLAHVSVAAISWRVWLAILYIIILPTAGAYFLNGWALARVPPSTVAVYIYLQPIIAFAVAPLVLGESLTYRTIIASLLIFAGVLVVTRRRSVQPALIGGAS
ncbi:MAG TPA: DMT family transporter [Pyrinomonadaceae bacterium]|nr:DMT family transporter [Pyrinomonadaceae bacterium]